MPKRIKLAVRVSNAIHSGERKEENSEVEVQKDVFTAKNVQPAVKIYAPTEHGEKRTAAEKPGRNNYKTEYKKHGQNQEIEKPDSEKIEKDKKLIMYSGVAFFMMLFIAFWFLNIKSIFNSRQNGDSGAQLKEISGQFRDSIKDLKENIKEIKSEISSTTKVVGGSDADNAGNVLPANSDIVGKNQIEMLKEKLEARSR